MAKVAFLNFDRELSYLFGIVLERAGHSAEYFPTPSELERKLEQGEQYDVVVFDAWGGIPNINAAGFGYAKMQMLAYTNTPLSMGDALEFLKEEIPVVCTIDSSRIMEAIEDLLKGSLTPSIEAATIA